MSPTKIVYRRLERKDLKRIVELHKEVLGAVRTVEFLEWKYFPEKGEHSIFVALDGENIVGQSGGVPTRFRMLSNDYMVMQEVDIAVLPAYQQSGVFFRMAKKSTQWDNDRQNMDYAFTIKKTYKIGTRFLRFMGVCPIFRQVKVLRPASFLQRKIKSAFLSNFLGGVAGVLLKLRYGYKPSLPQGMEITEITEFDDRFDQFWEQIADDYEIMIIKDAQYLNGRYVKHPAINYKIFTATAQGKLKGAIVLSAVQEDLFRGNLIDLMVSKDDQETAEALLRQAISFFYQERVDVVTGWFLEHSVLYPLLKKYGFIQKDTQHNLTVRSCSSQIETKALVDVRQWCITMGDSDYF